MKVKKKTEPFSFQKIGIFRLVNRFKGRALLADDVGLGKSLESIYAALPFRHKRPIVVICPAAVKLGWEVQIRTHTNLTCQFLRSRTPTPIIKPAQVIIINWEILTYWTKEIQKINPSVIIGDEIHYAKDSSTLRAKALREVCKGVGCVYGLSGTPIENCPVEFFVILNLLYPEMFPSYRKFAYRYSKPKFTKWGVKFSGAQNVRELNRLLRKHCMVRRLKEAVLKDLPPLIRSIVPMEIDNKKYEAAKKDIVAWIMQNKASQSYKSKYAIGAAKFNYLLQVIADLKFNSVVAWIDNFLETTDKKLTVFAHHRAFLERIYNKYKSQAVLVYGGVTGKKRKEKINQFVRNDRTRLFIGGITAAGTGINDLQLKCHDMVIAELIWVGMKLLQVEGRLHRIGQKNQVNINYLIAPNTIEDYLCKAIYQKQKDINAVVDAKFRKQEFDIFSQVINQMIKLENL